MISLAVDHKLCRSATGQLADYLRDEVLSGRFKPGQKLPTTRAMVEKAGVGTQTVIDALAQLRKEGLLIINRRGTFVNPDLANNSKLPVFASTESSVRNISIVFANMGLYQYGQFSEGVSLCLERLGLPSRIDVLQAYDSVDRQASALLTAIHRKSSGMLLIPPVIGITPPHHIKVLQDIGIPVVFCYRGIDGVDAPVVSWDWKLLGRKAAQCLLKYGHKRIAYLGSWRYCIAQSYEEGMREVMFENGLSMSDQHIVYNTRLEDDSSGDTGEEIFSQIENMLSSPHRPTAIFSSDTRLETLILLTAQKLGLRIPEDLSILQYGSKSPDCVVRKSIAKIGYDIHQIAAKSVEVLNEIMDGNRSIYNNDRINIDISISEGQTLSPPNLR